MFNFSTRNMYCAKQVRKGLHGKLDYFFSLVWIPVIAQIYPVQKSKKKKLLQICGKEFRMEKIKMFFFLTKQKRFFTKPVFFSTAQTYLRKYFVKKFSTSRFSQFFTRHVSPLCPPQLMFLHLIPSLGGLRGKQTTLGLSMSSTNNFFILFFDR